MAERASEHVRLTTGGSIAVDLYGGSGAWVLLLHGIPGSRHTWRDVASHLATCCRVVAPDLLGFGDSTDPPGDFHAPGQVGALRELMDRLGIDRAHVVGFDFGGPVALTLYNQEPNRFVSLTLVATNAFTDTPIPVPLNLARVPIVGDLLFLMLCSWAGLVSVWLPAVGDKKALPFHAFVERVPPARSRRWVRRVFLESLRNLRERYAAVEQVLATVNCPAAVIWGDRDPFFAEAVGRRTAAAIVGSRFVLLSGCGHFVPEERAHTLADTVLEFIR
ncbi:MAG TPA: alpha/beta hydrolase [Vicinamibacterales bacterium]|nr:alpha/beta hydrolase [Vicinamibacterales bacterium]